MPGLGLRNERAAVCLRDRAREGEPEARARGVGVKAHAGVENAVELVGRDPWPGVVPTTANSSESRRLVLRQSSPRPAR